MYYVKNQRNGQEIYDATVNLAIEYYLLSEKKLDEPILLFYINKNAIIIGKNQNTYEEINQDAVDKLGVQVVRRFSGGGAVYQDMGNICFCFLTEDDGNSFRDFGKFTQPVIEALHQMGATGAELKGRNDLLIEGKKFSGNAMYANMGRMTAHGTLMLDLNVDVLPQLLRPKEEKIASKGIKSVRSRVTNIKPYLAPEYQHIDILSFREALLKKIYQVDSVEEVKEYVLTEEDWEKIELLRQQYFNNPDWNYGKNPKFQLKQSKRTAVGQVEFSLNIEDNHIKDIKITGDFFGLGEISDVEEALRGVAFERSAVTNVFEEINLKKYFGNIEAKELADLLFN
ncbi:lipoate-protein ligase A [Granulicatella balaenopterae]|uniref:lipoate--protein ligase n=1 Tax=Granulicatella balaenopterae TaxID=137733 RepID=A0A1H9KLF9_9LACT|nr:lipoate--protein ligase [Granulicatella balaenopterae]SEQ99986.1 lipoate-protein ligase A [Granulicatella balaenopterae]